METLRLQTDIVSNEDGRFLILTNDGIGGHLKSGKRWEPHFTELVKRLNIENTVAIDVGANMGCNTVTLGRAVGERGLVVAFEPLRITYQQLCGNCILNGLHTVLALNLAIGDSINDVEMNPVNVFSPGVNIGDTSLGSGGDRVSMRPLDFFDFDNVSFIKIDVQGSELRVINGAIETLNRNKPMLFIELEEPQLQRQGTSKSEVVQLLKQLGYEIALLKNAYPVDHLCLPVERASELEPLLTGLGGTVERV